MAINCSLTEAEAEVIGRRNRRRRRRWAVDAANNEMGHGERARQSAALARAVVTLSIIKYSAKRERGQPFLSYSALTRLRVGDGKQDDDVVKGGAGEEKGHASTAIKNAVALRVLTIGFSNWMRFSSSSSVGGGGRRGSGKAPAAIPPMPMTQFTRIACNFTRTHKGECLILFPFICTTAADLRLPCRAVPCRK